MVLFSTGAKVNKSMYTHKGRDPGDETNVYICDSHGQQQTLSHCFSDGVVLSIEDEDLTTSGPTPHLRICREQKLAAM